MSEYEAYEFGLLTRVFLVEIDVILNFSFLWVHSRTWTFDIPAGNMWGGEQSLKKIKTWCWELEELFCFQACEKVTRICLKRLTKVSMLTLSAQLHSTRRANPRGHFTCIPSVRFAAHKRSGTACALLPSFNPCKELPATRRNDQPLNLPLTIPRLTSLQDLWTIHWVCSMQ